MDGTAAEPRHTLEIGGDSYTLDRTSYKASLFDMACVLVHEKLADRASFVFAGADTELGPVSASLYRHLKQQRCHGPPYSGLPGEAHSFRMHSIVDALVAAQFFCTAGELVPHLFIGELRGDLLSALDRGVRTQVSVEDPAVLERLRRLIPAA